ncbi:serpin family protein [Nocardia sp. NPDC049149]|uniref:serpin family protein n=1 Tax=Nocardia sp. NPDC049149 TaxID=3364315 RepID=UPI00371B4830
MGSEPVTRVVVAGTADLDVHLLLGTDTPGSVLGAGLAALAGAIPIRAELPPGTDGPGLTVRSNQVTTRTDLLVLRLPPFAIRSKHNLLDNPELMGLRSAADCERGHFPAISPMPLCIAQAAQDVLARFTPKGFEAAAVTAFAMRGGSAPPRPRLATAISATFDRPFGFLAVHRPTGLAVVAGWIVTPESAAD